MTISTTCRNCPARFVAEFVADPPAVQATRAGWVLVGERWVCPRCREREDTRLTCDLVKAKH